MHQNGAEKATGNPREGERKMRGNPRFLQKRSSAHGDYPSVGIGVYRGHSVSRCIMPPRRVARTPSCKKLLDGWR